MAKTLGTRASNAFDENETGGKTFAKRKQT